MWRGWRHGWPRGELTFLLMDELSEAVEGAWGTTRDVSISSFERGRVGLCLLLSSQR